MSENEHYRVGPGRCNCGFDAYKINGIMLDYSELLRGHLRAASKRDRSANASDKQRIATLEAQLAEAEARAGRLRKYADDIEDDLYNFHPEHPPWGYDSLIERRREDAELQPGDLPDTAGEET